jgi:hypothetical protein
MVVETLGDAFAAGWRITARCAWGKREGMKSRRECQYTRELDLETLVCVDARLKLSVVGSGWPAHVPTLPIASGGRDVPAAHGI